MSWPRALLAVVALAPGCVIPSSAGWEVISLTDRMWTATVDACQVGTREVPVGDETQPIALVRAVVAAEQVEVTSQWSDDTTRVHAGSASFPAGDALPVLRQEPGAVDEPRLQVETTQVPVDGTGGTERSLAPGDTLVLGPDALLVLRDGARRRFATLAGRTREEARYGVGRSLGLGSLAVLATPITAATDAVVFVLALPVFVVLLLMD